MAYATNAQFLQRYDARLIGDIVSDMSVRVPPADLLTNAVLTAALDDASGEIEAALMQGNRYTAAQLAALTGNSSSHLARLCCRIAWGLLMERRGRMGDVHRDEAMDASRAELRRLRSGEHVFDVEELKEAGNPSASLPTRVEYDRMNLIVDRCRPRVYPVRRIRGEG